VAGLTSLVSRKADEATTLAEGEMLLRDLVSHDDWLPDSQALSDSHRYQQFLLDADLQHRFSVVSFVWSPGQRCTRAPRAWWPSGSTATADRTKARQTPQRPCRRTSIGSMASSTSCVATAPPISA
jgi:hypothetical protein